MAVAGLVLGIISIVGAFIPGLNTIAWIIGIIGIILSAIARKNQPSGTATAGLVLSIIGTVFAFIMFLACVACAAAVGAAGGIDSLNGLF